MRPYPRRQASGNANKSRFNYKLSTTRVGIECTFGMAASKFRILLKSIETSVENAIKIVKAVCILHNIIVHMDGSQSELNVINCQINNSLRRIQRNAIINNRPTRSAMNAREKFTTYFSNQR